jgi:hypothetical protein
MRDVALPKVSTPSRCQNSLRFAIQLRRDVGTEDSQKQAEAGTVRAASDISCAASDHAAAIQFRITAEL